MTYQSAAMRAATRALSLLSVSLAEGEVGEYGVNLSAKGIRTLNREFLEELVGYVADKYARESWLEGIPADIQFVAFTHRPEPDRYGNSIWIELQYNARGHRCLLAMPESVWFKSACVAETDEYPYGILQDATSIYIYMD